MQSEREDRIAALLAQAGSAHGQYEERVLGGTYDEEWPDWYAAYLVEHGLNELIGNDGALTVERLSALLKQLDEEYRREKPADGWPTYYARRIASVPGHSVETQGARRGA